MSTDDRGETTVVVSLPVGLDAPAASRQFLAEHAPDLQPELLHDAQLLVSELVTNALTHGRPDITLQVRATPPGIGVAVSDHGTELPPTSVEPPQEPGSVHGRGLLLVDALADEWGVEPVEPPPGKTVWFNIAPHQ
jgi:anti-sigma regulatory factor (Ser/Thr protein kinase)